MARLQNWNEFPANSRHILVVDDDPLILDLLETLLRGDGYQVSIAIGGKAGLEQMRAVHPDLVILDLTMPEVSGAEVMRAKKEDEVLRLIPVILVTGKGSEQDRIAGLTLGADDYMTKPMDFTELLLRIRNILLRVQLSQIGAQANIQAKSQLLGDLFAELSHDIKNIFLGVGTLEPLKVENVTILLKAGGCSEEIAAIIAQQLLNEADSMNYQARVSGMPLPENSQDQSTLNNLRTNLAFAPFSLEEISRIWPPIRALPPEKHEFLWELLNLINQHETLSQSQERSQELFKSALDFMRESENPQSDLHKVMKRVIRLTSRRAKDIRAKIEVNLGAEERTLPLTPLALQRILLNLIMNALDAIEPLPTDERWITIQFRDNELEIVNGGPPIPETLRSKLFQTGMTTKGDKGTGLGLVNSRRLAQQFKWELILQANTPHPSFVLKARE